MARPSIQPAARLKALHRVKARVFALKRGEVVTAAPMAKLLSVSWPTLRGWCEDIDGFAASGAFLDGGMGVEYEFCPVRTLWFLIEHFQAEVDKLAGKNRDMQAATGITLADNETAVSFEEARGQVNLTVTVVAAAEKQGMYCLASDVADFIEGYNLRVTSGILGVRTVVDPNGALPPDIRTAMDTELRSVAAAAHGEAAAYIEEMSGAGLQQTGIGGARQAARQSPVLPKPSGRRRKAA